LGEPSALFANAAARQLLISQTSTIEKSYSSIHNAALAALPMLASFLYTRGGKPVVGLRLNIRVERRKKGLSNLEIHRKVLDLTVL